MDFDEPRYAELIGKRAERYLPRFRRFASRGEWISWNWAAFVGTLAWLRYRGLYRWSWLYFFVSTPMLVVWSLLPAAGDACRHALDPATPFIRYAIEALIAAGWIVPPLVADRLYFAEVRRLAARLSPDAKPAAPARSGAIVATLAVQVLVFVVAVASLPSYVDYTYRARVSEGVSLASAARVAVTGYVSEHGKLPARLEELAPHSGNYAGNYAGSYVAKLELVERGTIRATFGERAARLAGHAIELVPSWKGDAIVGWSCLSRDLPGVCLPPSCR